MNFQYRKKKYETDVLSFDGDFQESFGELVLCPQVLKKQSLQHDLSFRQELTYMLIHGILHLLGYDHETSEKDAQRMFHIQDSLFEKIVNL
jgi:probable rRNA maturation factor